MSDREVIKTLLDDSDSLSAKEQPPKKQEPELNSNQKAKKEQQGEKPDKDANSLCQKENDPVHQVNLQKLLKLRVNHRKKHHHLSKVHAKAGKNFIKMNQENIREEFERKSIVLKKYLPNQQTREEDYVYKRHKNKNIQPVIDAEIMFQKKMLNPDLVGTFWE